MDKTKERPGACRPLPLPGNRPSSVDPRLGLARRTASGKVCRDLGPVKSDSDMKAFGRPGVVRTSPEERLAARMLHGPSVVLLCSVDRCRTRSTPLGVGLREARGAHSSPARSLPPVPPGCPRVTSPETLDRLRAGAHRTTDWGRSHVDHLVVKRSPSPCLGYLDALSDFVRNLRPAPCVRWRELPAD